jgi:hypothetical protein
MVAFESVYSVGILPKGAEASGTLIESPKLARDWLGCQDELGHQCHDWQQGRDSAVGNTEHSPVFTEHT